MSVLLETSVGDMVIDLYCEQCPNTCKNFIKLCKVKYYNNCVFYYIEKDYVVQTGDPTNYGNEGVSIYGHLYGNQARYFEDEIDAKLTHARRGTVAMANARRNLNASQFYITTVDNLQSLDAKHTVFGMVSEGLDTLDKINNANVNEKKRPLQVLRILHTIILDDPFEDPRGLNVPDRSPSPDIKYFKDFLSEDLDMSNLTEEDIREELRVQDEKANSEILTLIGDIPDPNVKPPDTVLFVCKLNSTTTGKSLAIPFSRFGKIISCEVVYDRHGDSLCYAFIEFKEKSACEEAFVKMQNVVIDDRRIHVDFSQSVSKAVWNGYRGWRKYASDTNRSLSDHNVQDGVGELVLKSAKYKTTGTLPMVEDEYGYDMSDYYNRHQHKTDKFSTNRNVSDGPRERGYRHHTRSAEEDVASAAYNHDKRDHEEGRWGRNRHSNHNRRERHYYRHAG